MFYCNTNLGFSITPKEYLIRSFNTAQRRINNAEYTNVQSYHLIIYSLRKSDNNK